MGYLCPKCDKEISATWYKKHVRECKGKDDTDRIQEAERRFGA